MIEDIHYIEYWIKPENYEFYNFPVNVLTIIISNYGDQCGFSSYKSYNPIYNKLYKLVVEKNNTIAVSNLQSNNKILRIISLVVIKNPEKIYEVCNKY